MNACYVHAYMRLGFEAKPFKIHAILLESQFLINLDSSQISAVHIQYDIITNGQKLFYDFTGADSSVALSSVGRVSEYIAYASQSVTRRTDMGSRCRNKRAILSNPIIDARG